MPPDPTPRTTPQQLLEHDRFLRSLARSLVGEASTADDVVQQSYVAALERPQRYAGPLRAWLASIVRHLAWKRRRGDERRARHETALPRPDPVPSVAEVLAQEELRRQVVKAVLELDEPNRSTMLLRYFRQLSPGAIAKQLGVPVETVRTRIKRSLERLRVRLDSEIGEERGAWIVALLPFTKAAPVSVARVATGIGSAAGAILGGVLVMSVKAKLAMAAAAAALGIGVVVLVLEDPRPGVPRHADASSTTPALPDPATAGDRNAPDPVRAEREAAAPTTPAAPAAPASTLGSIHLKVIWAADRKPASDIFVSGVCWSRQQPYSMTIEGVTDAAGECTLVEVEPGHVYLTTDRGEGGDNEKRVDVRGGETTEVELSIAPGPFVEGVVVDDQDHPVAGADVWLSDNGCDPAHGHVLAHSDGQGAFAIRDVRGVRIISARAAGASPSAPQWVTGEPGTRLQIRLKLCGRGGVVRGRVLDSDGKPVRRALVQVGDEKKKVESPPDSKFRTLSALLLNTLSDDDGRFEFSGVMPGEQPIAARSRGFAPWRASVQVAPDVPADVTVALESGFTIEGSLKDTAQLPVAGASIEVGGSFGLAASFGRSGEDGTFRIEHLWAGEVEVAVDDDKRGRAKTKLRGRDGETVRWDAVLDRGLTVHGVVVDEEARPIEGCELNLSGPRFAPDASFKGTRSDSAGAFDFPSCAAGTYELEVRWPERGYTLAAFLNDVQPAADALTIKLDRSRRCTAFIEGTVIDDVGAPAANAVVSAHDDSGLTRAPNVMTDAATGRFRCGPFTPGTFKLWVRLEGYPDTAFPIGAVAANETKDLGQLRLVRGGKLRVKLSKRAGGALEGVIVTVSSKATGMDARVAVHDDVATGEALAAGDYRIRVSAAGCAVHVTSVTVRASETTDTEVVLEPGTAIALHCRLSDDVAKRRKDLATNLYARVIAQNGDEIGASTMHEPQGGPRFDWELTLAPGQYKLEIRENVTLVDELSFEVTGATKAGTVIEVAMTR